MNKQTWRILGDCYLGVFYCQNSNKKKGIGWGRHQCFVLDLPFFITVIAQLPEIVIGGAVSAL